MQYNWPRFYKNYMLKKFLDKVLREYIKKSIITFWTFYKGKIIIINILIIKIWKGHLAKF